MSSSSARVHKCRGSLVRVVGVQHELINEEVQCGETLGSSSLLRLCWFRWGRRGRVWHGKGMGSKAIPRKGRVVF